MKPILCLFFIAQLTSLAAQEKSHDFSQIDHVIKTLYCVISGPAGDRDWNLFRSLFHQKAIMGATSKNKEGEKVFNSFTPEEYVQRNGAVFKNRGFFEEEIERITHQYGGVAQVFTSYQYQFEKEGPIIAKGINCVQLAFIKDRWYITQIIWEAESEGNPLKKLKTKDK